ncbi:hypothetical protein [Microbulbifer sp. JMSA003]|uniref:hypothetical protein n=1 Tax=Microbulbifer sp. JMSA003 TaxID=3243369 RepID=UPI00403A0945
MKIKQILIALLFSASGVTEAIEACSEHDYCPPQGTIHVMVSPKVSRENRKLCDGATFVVHFSLRMGEPENIVINSSPDALRLAIIKSFKRWRFGATEEVNGAVEKFSLTPACFVQKSAVP